MSSLDTLVTEGPWCVFYAARRQVYWGLTLSVFLLVLWFDKHTHRHRHTGPVYWHIHINTYLHHLLCAHSSYLYYIKWIIHWYQKFTFHNAFSFQKLFTCKSHISVD